MAKASKSRKARMDDALVKARAQAAQVSAAVEEKLEAPESPSRIEAAASGAAGALRKVALAPIPTWLKVAAVVGAGAAGVAGLDTSWLF